MRTRTSYRIKRDLQSTEEIDIVAAKIMAEIDEAVDTLPIDLLESAIDFIFYENGI